MATLVITLFSANETDITNARVVQFGDGYQQRFTFGLNQMQNSEFSF